MQFFEFDNLLQSFKKKRNISFFEKNLLFEAFETAQTYTVSEVTKRHGIPPKMITALLKRYYGENYSEFKKKFKRSPENPYPWLTKKDVKKVFKLKINHSILPTTHFIIKDSITGRVLGSETTHPHIAFILRKEGIIE